jgi:HSP20 family molecular chaperone IbpA
MVLMRFDPLRKLDRLADQAISGARVPRTQPMEALRRGDQLTVAIDVPGVDPKDVTVERQALHTGSAQHETVNA